MFVEAWPEHPSISQIQSAERFQTAAFTDPERTSLPRIKHSSVPAFGARKWPKLQRQNTRQPARLPSMIKSLTGAKAANFIKLHQVKFQ
jgi:hypothetical protein